MLYYPLEAVWKYDDYGSEKDVVDWYAILCASQSFDGVCEYFMLMRSFTSI